MSAGAPTPTSKMIQADTRELEAKLRQTVLGIREKEVSLFTDQFAVLASSATFMSSLGFGALNMEIGFLEREDEKYCSELVGCDGSFDRVLTPMILFYTLAAAGTAFNLLTVVLASYCMIFGPELAIRGTEDSMHHAVRGMYEERRLCLKFFWVGCLFIVLSGVALSWMKFPVPTAAVVTVVFALLIWFCVFSAQRIAPKFAYVDDTEDVASLMRRTTTGNQQQGHPSKPGNSASGNPYSAVPTNNSSSPSSSSPRHPQSSSYGSTTQNNNLIVGGKLRYAIFADNLLRIFSIDGTLVSSHRASDQLKMSSNPPGFYLQDGTLCTGTSETDTQTWIAMIRNTRRPPPVQTGERI